MQKAEIHSGNYRSNKKHSNIKHTRRKTEVVKNTIYTVSMLTN